MCIFSSVGTEASILDTPRIWKSERSFMKAAMALGIQECINRNALLTLNFLIHGRKPLNAKEQ